MSQSSIEFDQLPDELLLHILSYSIHSVRSIIKLSHISKRMEDLLNSNPEFFSESPHIKLCIHNFIDHEQPNDNIDHVDEDDHNWKHVELSKQVKKRKSQKSRKKAQQQRKIIEHLNISNREFYELMRKGYLIGKFCEKPLSNSFSLFKEFIAELFNKRLINDKRIEMIDSEMKNNVNSKKKLVECLGYSKFDPKETMLKIHNRTTYLYETYGETIAMGIVSLFLLSTLLILGKISSLPFDQKSIAKELWFPYTFWPFVLLINGWNIFALLLFLFNSLYVMRCLVIIESGPSGPNSSVFRPIVYLLYSLFWRILQFFIRIFVFEMSGLKLGGFESVISSIMNWSVYLVIVFLGVACSHSVRGNYSIIKKVSDPTLGGFISLVLYKASSGSLLSFIPLSISFVAISIESSNENLGRFAALAFATFLLSISFGHFSYLTLTPISLASFIVFIRMLIGRKR